MRQGLVAYIVIFSIFLSSCALRSKSNTEPDFDQAVERAKQYYQYFNKQEYGKMWDMLSLGMRGGGNDKDAYVRALSWHYDHYSVKVLKVTLFEKRQNDSFVAASLKSDLEFTHNISGEKYPACSGTTWRWMPYPGNWYLAREDFLFNRKCTTG